LGAAGRRHPALRLGMDLPRGRGGQTSPKLANGFRRRFLSRHRRPGSRIPLGRMNVLEGIARLAIAAPRRIIAVALLVMVGAGIFGIPVSKSLSAGGLQDPTSESWQAARLLSEKFGQGDMHMVIAVTSEAGAESLAARAVGADLVRGLQASPHVADVNSAWTASPPDAATMISKDGKTGLIVAGVT